MWLRKVIGYVAATLAISIVGFVSSALLIAAFAAADGEADWSLFSEGGMKVFSTGLVFITALALPVWLVGDTYATRRSITHAGWFVKAGASGAAAAILLISLFTINSSFVGGIGRLGAMAGIAILGMCGGAVGGFVYWAIGTGTGGQA